MHFILYRLGFRDWGLGLYGRLSQLWPLFGGGGVPQMYPKPQTLIQVSQIQLYGGTLPQTNM